MHLIITDAWMAKSRPIHLTGSKLLLSGLAVSLVIMLAAAGLYHWVFVEGAQEAPVEDLSIEAGAKLVRAEIEKGLSKKDAVKLVAKQTGLPRNALYEAALQDED